MRLVTLLTVALPVLVSAQEQIPFLNTIKGFAGQAQDKLDSILNAATRVGASTVSSASVNELSVENWRYVLKHSGTSRPGDPPEAWMVFVTGGNKSCHGHCGRADKAWDEAVTYLVADVSAPHLALLDCDRQEVLCGAWAAEIGSVWVFLVPHPQPDQSRAPTQLTIHNLNLTSVESGDITKIHTRKTYLSKPPYEGALHPFDGWVAQYGITMPMAYALWGMAKIPSWAFMIGLSFFSRYFVNKRMPTGQMAAGAPPPGAAPAPAGRR